MQCIAHLEPFVKIGTGAEPAPTVHMEGAADNKGEVAAAVFEVLAAIWQVAVCQ